MDAEEQTLLTSLANGEFAFADFGCGTGGSLKYCEGRFPMGKGLGFDKKPTKIEACKTTGIPIVGVNVLEIDLPESCIRYASMMDFLEHLPSIDDAKNILAVAKRMAKDFIFIRHPSFEDIDYQFGLKIDWTDWNGHTNMMTLEDYHKVFAELDLPEYTIIPRTQIFDTHHECVVPASAPTDTVRYKEELGPKELIYFNRPVWSQFEIIVKLNKDISREEWLKLIAPSITG